MGESFIWDADKAIANLTKHRVPFSEAATVFMDSLSLTIPDPRHSSVGEQRYVTIGNSVRGRVLVVVHVDLPDTIRLISARVATRRERRQYEEG